MIESIDPLALAGSTAALLAVALYIPPLNLPFGRAALRLVVFGAFTAALLHAGISPNHAIPASEPPVQRDAGQFLVVVWWFGCAAVVNSVVRASLRFRHRPERERLVQDLATTAAYLLATLQVSSKVFGLPVGALLATSGAVAIVVGLALQSALGDAFSGLLLNLTRPYKIGDWIAVDASLEGRVIETNWRATHLLTAERNIAIVPNSTLAKARFINTTVASPIRGITTRLQLRPDIRPQTALTALEHATFGHMEILRDPQPQVSVRTSTVDFVEYEVRFFVKREVNESVLSSRYLDLAFQHLDSMSVDRTPPASPQPAHMRESFQSRLIDGIESSLSRQPNASADRHTQIKEYPLRTGEVLIPGEHYERGTICVRSGVMSVRKRGPSDMQEVARLNPGDYWPAFESAGSTESSTCLCALTDCKVLHVRDGSSPAQVSAISSTVGTARPDVGTNTSATLSDTRNNETRATDARRLRLMSRILRNTIGARLSSA